MIQSNPQTSLPVKAAVTLLQNAGFLAASLLLANFLFAMVGLIIVSIAILGTLDDSFNTYFQNIITAMLQINPDIDPENYKKFNQTDLANLIKATLLKLNIAAAIVLFFTQHLKFIRAIKLSLSLKIKAMYSVSFLLAAMLLITYFVGNLAEKSTAQTGFTIVPLLTFMMLAYVTFYPLPLLLAHHFITKVLERWLGEAEAQKINITHHT